MHNGTTCVACNTSECGTGYYRGQCGSSWDAGCEACTTKPQHAGYLTPGRPSDTDNCSWSCDAGYWRSVQSCVTCTTSACPAGQYRDSCGEYQDARCLACDAATIPKYSHFIGSLDVHTCAWACNVGYNYNQTSPGECVSSVAPYVIVTLPSVAMVKEWDTSSTTTVSVKVSFMPDDDVVVNVTVS